MPGVEDYGSFETAWCPGEFLIHPFDNQQLYILTTMTRKAVNPVAVAGGFQSVHHQHCAFLHHVYHSPPTLFQTLPVLRS